MTPPVSVSLSESPAFVPYPSLSLSAGKIDPVRWGKRLMFFLMCWAEWLLGGRREEGSKIKGPNGVREQSSSSIRLQYCSQPPSLHMDESVGRKGGSSKKKEEADVCVACVGKRGHVQLGQAC